MKVIIRLILVFTIGGLTVLIAQKLRSRENKDAELNNRFKTMPAFTYIPVNRTPVKDSTVSILTTVINYFNTHCQFCQYEIKDFLEYQYLFEKTQFFLLSDQPLDTLKIFTVANKIDLISTITIGQVDYTDFIDQFGEVIPPTTFIYDSSKCLISNYKGQIRASTIAEDIKKHYQKIEP